MAEQQSIVRFRGRLGNLIGYYRNGKYFIRSMPQHVHQTRATRRAAERFGIASRKAALIRSAFCDDLDIHGNNSFINRLNSVLIKQATHNMTAVTGFRFNQDTGLEKFFEIIPALSEDATLHIPAQSLPQLKGITAFEVKVIAARMHFGTLRIISTDAAILNIDPRQPFDGASIPLNVPGNGTLMVTVQIRAMQGETPSYNRRYQAADIIGVLVPQKPLITQHDIQQDKATPLQQPARITTPPSPRFIPPVQRE